MSSTYVSSYTENLKYWHVKERYIELYYSVSKTGYSMWFEVVDEYYSLVGHDATLIGNFLLVWSLLPLSLE